MDTDARETPVQRPQNGKKRQAVAGAISPVFLTPYLKLSAPGTATGMCNIFRQSMRKRTISAPNAAEPFHRVLPTLSSGRKTTSSVKYVLLKNAATGISAVGRSGARKEKDSRAFYCLFASGHLAGARVLL